MIILSPLFLLIMLALKIESKGPVFYISKRAGRGYNIFNFYKFRTMVAEANDKITDFSHLNLYNPLKENGPVFIKIDNDPRITRIGAFLRKCSLDELPQLVNVLKGEMSLVGPRPERSFFVEQLAREIPYYSVRHSVKPGITGWAQIKYQYGATLKDSIEKLQFDLYYVKNSTLFLDLVILFQTVAVVVSGKGAR